MKSFLLNGRAHGDVAGRLMESGGDPGALRPWKGRDGHTYITITGNDGKPQTVPVTNAPATLRKDDWILLDEAIVRAAKPRLRAVADVRGAGLQYTIPNGMGKTILETETQSDISAATISMDGLKPGQEDRPEFNLGGLPLPIIHKDFSYPLRQILASRNGGSPLDTTTAELAGRRVAEEAEKMLLGVSDFTGYAFGGGTIYGMVDFPDRLTKSLTDPTSSGWTPAKLVQEVLQMKNQSQDAYHFGPWMIYHAPAWDEYMDDDYSANKGDNTLRQRLRDIDGIQDVRTLDYLRDANMDLILVQMTADVVREVVGMEITTLQWETDGGLNMKFKVMGILVPQFRSDFNGNTGVVHGTV